MLCRCLVIVLSIAASTNAFSIGVPSVSKSAPVPVSQVEPTSTSTPKHGETAIVLNTNARSVSSNLIPVAESVFGPSNVFVTSTAEQAQEAARTICKQGYSLVVPVGGDGTLSGMINLLRDEIIASQQKTVEEAIGSLPLMGYIPLGTGNGVGYVVGCRVSRDGLFRRGKIKNIQSVMEQLKEAGEKAGQNQDLNIVEIPMMEVTHNNLDLKKYANGEALINGDDLPTKGDLCFFAGVGFDSLMLNDFKELKAWSIRRGVFRRALGSVAGYCVALVAKTLPKCVWHGRHNIKVTLTTRDTDTLWVDHRRGDYCERALPASTRSRDATGEEQEKQDSKETTTPQLLYSGTTGILAAGTSPFYGGGLRLFPFARLTTDKMHLRLGRINPLIGFLNIPKIFEGSYREKSDKGFGCIDFIGSDFEVQLNQQLVDQEVSGEAAKEGFPFQHSGESVGYVDRFRLKVAKEKVRFVCFLPKRVVVDR